MIDAHHHLWDLGAVHYPWLMAKGVRRFFGDPAPIQRNYLLREFRRDAVGFSGSVHIQVGAADPVKEAQWVQTVADGATDWTFAQVVHADLTAGDLFTQLNTYQKFPTVRGVRQIIGRAPGEDAQTGTQALLDNPAFVEGLIEIGSRGLSFDLQLIPELMEKTAAVLAKAPQTPVVLCHAGSPHDRSENGLRMWSEQLTALSDLPHVSCKLSGLGMFDHDWTEERIQPIVSTCISQFGSERVMFGSNFPVDMLTSSYAHLFEAMKNCVPQDSHAAIFGENARRFYRL